MAPPSSREGFPGMALRPLSPSELAATPTVFASFMGARGAAYKTLGQLRAIYRERSKTLASVDDHDDHLRVERFAEDMANERWTDDVVMRIGVFDETVLLIDGIHRGIAYLTCVQGGVSRDRLPALHLDC
jgi:hypothetical protein